MAPGNPKHVAVEQQREQDDEEREMKAGALQLPLYLGLVIEFALELSLLTPTLRVQTSLLTGMNSIAASSALHPRNHMS